MSSSEGSGFLATCEKSESGDDFYGIQTIANIGSFYEDDDDYSYMEVNTMVTG